MVSFPHADQTVYPDLAQIESTSSVCGIETKVCTWVSNHSSTTMRATVLPTIFTCIVLSVRMCNSQPEPPIPQEPKTGSVRFHLISQGRLAIKGGESGDFSDYKTDDGIRVHTRIESWRSADRVHDAMQKLRNQAFRIVDTHPKLDEHGRTIGERVVFQVQIRHSKSSLALVAWIKERNLYVIESPNLDYALAFEARFYPSKTMAN